MDKFLIKETEKAIYVEARFENFVLESEKTFKIWIPKSCIEQKDNGINIKSWFLKNKIEELFGYMASSVMFLGLKLQKEAA